VHEEQWGYSPAVVTEGGRIVWLAGHAGIFDDAGNLMEGDFDGQARQTFKDIAKTLARAKGTLRDIVTMTVFLLDATEVVRMTNIRKEIFGRDFPGSAAIIVSGFAHPAMMIEIQAVAVIPE